MSHHRVQQWATFARLWWIYDAKWQCPFTSAPVLIKYLSGEHKPIFHPLSDVGDNVVVINTREIAMKEQKWRTLQYVHHTGYPGGLTRTRAYKVHDADPTKVLYKAVYHTMKGNLLRRPRIARLHMFPNEDVPKDILKNISGQIKQVQPVPKRLHEYTEEEREMFPRLFDWPEDYVKTQGHKKPKS